MRLCFLIAGLVGCAGENSCGLSLGGGHDKKTDPVLVLDTWSGSSFSELGDLEVDGNTIWFCTGVEGVHAWDISQPDKLRKLDDLVPLAGDLRYPRCQHLAVQGKRVYVSHRGDSISEEAFLLVIDASDPRHLEEHGTLQPDYSPEGLAVHGDLLLVAGHDAGLVIYDRGKGAELTELSRTPTANAWQVRAEGDIAWVADAETGLVAVDITDPSHPIVRGSVDVDGGAFKDLELRDQRAYVAAASAGLAVIDTSDPDAPSMLHVADTPGSALGVALGPKTAFVSDWNDVRLFDISGDAKPRALGHEPLPLQGSLGTRTLGIAADGNVFFSGNWTELVSYEYFPGRSAPDIDVRPARLDLTSGRELLTVLNVGQGPLTVQKAKPHTNRLSVDGLASKKTVASGAELRLTVTLDDPRDPFESWLNLISDDPDEPRRCVSVQASQPGLGVGDRVPRDTSWIGLDGDPLTLSDHEGKAVLLAYFATF